MNRRTLILGCLALPAACAAPTVSSRSEDVAALARTLAALSPDVDPAEAQRAAAVTYAYVDQLVIEYEIEDGPLIHNTKVNTGLKPRGLCWHWAHDIRARLALEGFKTLELHSAIANHNTILLEHSTTILSARGAPFDEGILLDPWRKGGVLTWMKVRDDARYDWWERQKVFDWKRARRAAQGAS